MFKIFYTGGLFMILQLCCLNILSAQVLPPELQCLRNDTLFWELPANSCGPFVSYDIYVSTQAQGPFTLLTAVTDPAQTLYHHANPSGQLLFYYMQSNYNCPGQQVLTSDTIDNQSPELNPIESVSVTNGLVEIRWQPNPSPEVSAYIIYRTTPQGTIPVDTVYNSNSYIDPNATPGQKMESYYVIAMDDCGNTSGFDKPHFTIFASEAVSICEQTVTISWSMYENWPLGISRHEIWMGTEGDLPVLIDTVAATDTSYIYAGLSDSIAYCFFVKALRENNTAVFSNSNEVCFTTDIVQPMRNITISNASVSPDNSSVELQWFWDDVAEIKSYEILSTSVKDNTTTSQAFSPSFPLSHENNFSDPTALPAETSLIYQIQTTDDCDSIAFSNIASTIYLSGTPQRNLTNYLQWTPYNSQGAVPEAYELYRIVDGRSSLLAELMPEEIVYADPVDASNRKEASVCYYLVARATIILPGGNAIQVRTRSNTVCVEQFSTVLVPNAFAPEGRNYEFMPRVVFGENADYSMTIYDRWGQKLFESRDINKGWTGKKGNQLLPFGVYTYLIRVIQPDGQAEEKSGTFLLLR